MVETSTPQQLWLSQAPYAAVERHLVNAGLNAELEHVSGITKIFPFDSKNRPVAPTLQMATSLTEDTGAPSILLQATPTDAPFPGAPRFTMQGTHIELSSPARRSTADEVDGLLRDLGIRPNGDEQWIIAGRIPRNGRTSLERMVAIGLSEAPNPTARIWTSAPAEDAADEHIWFAAVIEVAPPAESGIGSAVDTGELVFHLARVLRSLKVPLLVAHVRPQALELFAVNSRRWTEFPLMWGHRRGWVHPVHGSGNASNDAAATRFAEAWQRAGGQCDVVSLRALGRRVALGAEALPQALAALGMHPDLVEVATAVAAHDRSFDETSVVGEADVPRWMRALNRPTPVNRFANALSAAAAGALIANVAHDGIGGWDWLMVALFGIVLATGVAGALRHEKPSEASQPNSAGKVAS